MTTPFRVVSLARSTTVDREGAMLSFTIVKLPTGAQVAAIHRLVMADHARDLLDYLIANLSDLDPSSADHLDAGDFDGLTAALVDAVEAGMSREARAIAGLLPEPEQADG